MHPAAVWALEVGKLNDGDLGICGPKHGIVVHTHVDFGWLQRDRHVIALAQFTQKRAFTLLPSALIEIICNTAFDVVKRLIDTILIFFVEFFDFIVCRLGHFGGDFFLAQLFDRHLALLSFKHGQSLSDNGVETVFQGLVSLGVQL